jgi:hypothetical protein
VNAIRAITLMMALTLCASTSGAQQNGEPPLPPGLGAPDGAPALPPGLEASDDAPPLPPGLEAEPEKPGVATEDRARPGKRFPLELHGFWETRGGMRMSNDPAQPRDAILGETRLQLEGEHGWDRVLIDFTADFVLDGVLEEADFDLRRLRLTLTPFEQVDIRIGRQVLTWGTGDLLFINDLFPKDFQSFLIGRDEEYLKAPSDAVKIGWFNKMLNVEFVYTPRFDPDRFITGERISFFNPGVGRRVGREDPFSVHRPRELFEDDEFALRLYRTAGAYELALYGYAGFWKSPGGQQLWPPGATFPRLNVYGASARGPLGGGIANMEVGYYDSRDDPGGRSPFVNNDEFRLLIGYERELGKEFTGGFQYYLEHILDYGRYRDTLPSSMAPRDENRHLFTLRLTKLLMDQNLSLSFFTFYSPSDNDVYVRPKASYKVTDAWAVEAGANLFAGAADHTFFGQLEKNTNVYASLRFSF